MDEAAARAVLGVGPGAGPEEVRTAFRRAVAAVHPDRSPAADAAERTRAVTEAWAVLRAVAAAAGDTRPVPAVPPAGLPTLALRRAQDRSRARRRPHR